MEGIDGGGTARESHPHPPLQTRTHASPSTRAMCRIASGGPGGIVVLPFVITLPPQSALGTARGRRAEVLSARRTPSRCPPNSAENSARRDETERTCHRHGNDR